MIHEVVRVGFGREADTYERSRPTYPPGVVAWLVEHLRLAPGRRVVDLAAGTGKLTRLLLPTGAGLLAVEPVPEMRELCQRLLPAVPVMAGVAEALPFRTGALDAVTVAQAFHWFDADAAFAELHRVLRPGGRLAIVWNVRDRSVEWVDRAWSIMDRVEQSAPWRNHERWDTAALGARHGFGPLASATFRHEQACTPDQLVERFQGVSHVAVLPDDQRAAVLDEVRELVATHPDTRGRPELRLPYRVDCYWCGRD